MTAATAKPAARTSAQRLSAAQSIAALEASPSTTPLQEVTMSTIANSDNSELIAQIRSVLAAAPAAPTAAPAPAPAAPSAPVSDMGNMPTQMADKWAVLRLDPAWRVIDTTRGRDGFNRNGCPLNKWGVIIGARVPERAWKNETPAPLAAFVPAAAPAAITPTLSPEVLAALRTLGVLPAEGTPALVQPAAAPAPKAPKAPKAETRRITLDEFLALHPDVREDLVAAVMGTVFVPGGSWGVFRVALLGR